MSFLRLRVDTIGGKISGALTLDLYDVNSNAADSCSRTRLRALLRRRRLITIQQFAKTDLKDTINIRIPGQAILSRKGGRMRIGFALERRNRFSSDFFRRKAREARPMLSYEFRRTQQSRRSSSRRRRRLRRNQPILATSFADYTLLVKGTATGPATQLNVGGLPARRVYMRFNIPSFLIDSVDVVRATLLLTQIRTSIDPGDTVLVTPQCHCATVQLLT